MSVVTLFPFPGAGGGSATLVIPSATVGSNLTDFPLYIRLSDMPASFWASSNDGNDLRAYDGASQIPCDIVWADPIAEDGVAFAKIPTVASGSDTEITLTWDGVSDRPAANSTYGQNSVWSDYDYVSTFGIGTFNRAGNGNCRIIGDPDSFVQTDEEQVLASWCHDGVASDGVHRYIFNGNSIEKYDLAWTLVASNSDPAGDSGLALVNDLGSGQVHEGIIYVSLGDNPGATVQYIAKYDASDLSFIEAYDVSATSVGLAGVCIGPNGNLWGIIYGDGSELIEYDINDGSIVSTVTITGDAQLEFTQGLEYWQGAFWLSVEENSAGLVNETYRVEVDGTSRGGHFSKQTSDGWPGVTKEGFALLQADEFSDNSDERVRTYVPYDLEKMAGGGAHFDGLSRIIGDLPSTGSLGTSWTIGCSFRAGDTTQRAIMALCETGTGFSSNVHVVNDNGNMLAVWDQSNGWLYCSPNVNPGTTNTHRVNVRYNGTTDRKIYHNGGASTGTDSGITTRGTGVSHAVAGSSREGSHTESWVGELGFIYARADVLSDDWIAAEFANLNDPSTFYTIS